MQRITRRRFMQFLGALPFAGLFVGAAKQAKAKHFTPTDVSITIDGQTYPSGLEINPRTGLVEIDGILVEPRANLELGEGEIVRMPDQIDPFYELPPIEPAYVSRLYGDFLLTRYTDTQILNCPIQIVEISKAGETPWRIAGAEDVPDEVLVEYFQRNLRRPIQVRPLPIYFVGWEPRPGAASGLEPFHL